MELALALGVVGLLWPASALAKWGPTITVTPTGVVPGAVLDNRDVLHATWQQTFLSPYRVRSSFAEVTRRGHVTPSGSALDRHVPVGQVPSWTMTFLSNGDAVRCATNRQENRLFAFFYSRSGALIKVTKLADRLFDGNAEDQCAVSASGNHAAITWAVPGTVSTKYQQGRQLLVSQISPGLRLSTPVAALPADDNELGQLCTCGKGLQETMAVTRSGWIALAWPYTKISKETASDRVAQVSQWRMRWINPSGTLGQVIALEPQHGGQLCDSLSPVCGDAPAPPVLGAVAKSRVMAVFDYPTLASEEIDTTGTVFRRRDVPAAKRVWPRIAYSGLDSVASGGGKLLVTWWPDRGHGSDPVRAIEWSGGRWGPVNILAVRHGADGIYFPQALMNDRGQGCVVWYRIVDAPQTDNGTYASFTS